MIIFRKGYHQFTLCMYVCTWRCSTFVESCKIGVHEVVGVHDPWHSVEEQGACLGVSMQISLIGCSLRSVHIVL